jgi:N-sulfoglucosamine sulfohydrolase
MNRRDLLKGTVGFGPAAAGAAAATADTSQSKPIGRNILLIIADDQGYDLSRCDGKVKTPVLDELAASGTLFTQGYVTVSSCSSSRSTLYTGLYSHTNGMYLAAPP